MRPASLIKTSWSVLAIAIVVWIVSGYFAWMVLGMQKQHEAYVGSVQNALLEQAHSAQVRTVARETVAERELLENNASIDLITAVNMIEAIGEAAGIRVEVSDAQSSKPITGKAGTLPINVVNFSIETKGPYASVMRVLQLLETAPMPVSIQQVNVAQIKSLDPKAAASWALNVNLKFFTTATISS